MRDPVQIPLSQRLCRAAMTTLAIGIVVAPAIHANPSNDTVVVPPNALPELARHPGDAMFLQNADDGTTVLYIEQNQGAQLAIFDVTDPRHVRSEGAIQLSAPGPFDFVSNLGDQQELVRFRKDQAEAVLDLHKTRLPHLNPVRAPAWHGPNSPQMDIEFAVDSRTETAPSALQPQRARDYHVVEDSNAGVPNRVIDVQQVHEVLTNQITGTTFLLSERGLYIIRRPVVESDKKRRDQDWFSEHNGG